MSNIKDKLFPRYNKDRLTVVDMAFILAMRAVGCVLTVFFVICLIIGMLIPAIVSAIRALLVDGVLWKKWQWCFAGEWAQAMKHEIDRPVMEVIDILSN